MKYLILLPLLTSLFACNQSVKKDFSTGSYSRGKGISCNDIKIEVNGQFTSRKKFVYGEKVKFVFNNIVGLKKINGKVYPELSVCVLDSKKDTILSNPKLLKLNNGADLSPLKLDAYFNAFMPVNLKEKYRVYLDIWDTKGTGTFHYEMPFTVKENKVLRIKKQGINYSKLYLWDETKKLIVVRNKIDPNNKLYLILEGLDGLKEVGKNIFPSLYLKLTDSKGNNIISKTNLLEEYSNKGIPAEDLKKGKIPVMITFSTTERMNNPCKFEAILTDLKSDKKITINANLEIEP